MCSQFSCLFRSVTIQNLNISSVLGSTNPFSWNLNFHRDLSDFEIGDLKKLMSSLSHLHLSPSGPNLRAWSLSSWSLFTVKSFFSIMSNHTNQIPSFPTDSIWKSQALFEVESFAWLVAHKKVNINDMLQLKRSNEALNPNVCLLCMESSETVNHIFLHCLRLWYRLFNLAHKDWVPYRSICDMMIIPYKGLERTITGKVL